MENVNPNTVRQLTHDHIDKASAELKLIANKLCARDNDAAYRKLIRVINSINRSTALAKTCSDWLVETE